jgi:Flp pilus assembly protein TadG
MSRRSPAAGGRERDDRGAAVVEFVLVTVPLVVLLLAVLQVAAYLHLRAVVVAGAAEGARHGAAADRSTRDGGPAAERVLAAGVSPRTAAAIRCAATEQAGAGGAVLVVVRCAGAVPALVPLVGPVLPVDVTARALKEGR